jgi:Cd2+/Zn2+-exporting ATPase
MTTDLTQEILEKPATAALNPAPAAPDHAEETYAEETHSVGLNNLLKLRLINSIFATVLLLTGLAFQRLFPEQSQLAALIMAVGALAVGFPVFWQGLAGLFSKQPRFMTEQLVSLAVLASMLQGDFITASLVPIIMVVGHLLEEKSIIGVEQAIASLKKMHNSKARRLNNGTETLVETAILQVGDLVACYPGELIPVDGVVTEGESAVNQATITGESLPVDVFCGAKVFAGTTNISGRLSIKMNKPMANTVLNEIVALLAEAEKSKAPIVKLIERYLGLYFPFIIMLAAITLFLTEEVSRAIAVLVISCPCALVLASPSAMIGALVRASRHGIMIKNTAFLESLAEVDTIVFDKTGTLTLGELKLEKIELGKNVDEAHFLQIAGMCASGSIHPVSSAIIAHLRATGVFIVPPRVQHEVHGQGVEVTKDDKAAGYIGKLDWIISKTSHQPISLNETKEINVWVADDTQILGRIIFSDQPRPEMHKTIQELHKHWVKRVVLLTGDKLEIAQRVGTFLGVDEIVANCLPQDKLEYVRVAKASGRAVMFVGDGINDSLALKASDVGVAIANVGSSIAVQSSDITLRSTNLSNILKMFQLSRETRLVINQNIFIGAGFSFVLVGLASFGVVSPVVGALAHNLGPVFVLINSARLIGGKADW